MRWLRLNLLPGLLSVLLIFSAACVPSKNVSVVCTSPLLEDVAESAYRH